MKEVKNEGGTMTHPIEEHGGVEVIPSYSFNADKVHRMLATVFSKRISVMR